MKFFKVIIYTLLLFFLFLLTFFGENYLKNGGSKSEKRVGTTDGFCQLSSEKSLTWARAYGGERNEYISSVLITSDGGVAIVGYSSSFDEGKYDFLIIKLDMAGEIEWIKTYGGDEWDYPRCATQTSDGGFLVGGYTSSFGCSDGDFFILKLGSKGDISWGKTLGGGNYDRVNSLVQTSDGGFLLSGATESFGEGKRDVLLIKIDLNGNLVWAKTYGGADDDEMYSFLETSDGDLVFAGYTVSFGDVNRDILVMKLNSSGEVLWAKTYGGSDFDSSLGIIEKPDKGFWVVGETRSSGAGELDALVINLDLGGNVLWAKTYGGVDEDSFLSVRSVLDGGFLVSGYTSSSGFGQRDVLFSKLDEDGNILWAKTYGGSEHESAYFMAQSNDGGFIVGGYTGSFGEGGHDYLAIKLNSEGNIPGCQYIKDFNPTVGTFSLSGISRDLGVNIPNIEVKSVNPVEKSPYLIITSICGEKSFDINGDGKVSVVDLIKLLNVITGNFSLYSACDLNNDGKVDVNDASILSHYLISN